MDCHPPAMVLLRIMLRPGEIARSVIVLMTAVGSVMSIFDLAVMSAFVARGSVYSGGHSASHDLSPPFLGIAYLRRVPAAFSTFIPVWYGRASSTVRIVVFAISVPRYCRPLV